MSRAISAARCREHRRRPGFRMPDPARWQRQLDFHGFRALGGLEQARRLFGWARFKPGRVERRRARRWVAYVLLRQHRQYPGELTIAAGAAQIARLIGDLGGPQISRTTVQRVLDEMRADAVLYRAQRGCSAKFTGGSNHVSVYVVIAPDELDDDARRAIAELQERLSGHLPVRVSGSGTVGGSPARSTGDFSIKQRTAEPDLFAPRNADERAVAVDYLARSQGWHLTSHDADELRKLAYPAFAGGWSARALAAALGRRPGPDGAVYDGPLPGERQRDRARPVRVRSLIRVLTWRLRPWLTEAPRWADRRPAFDPPVVVPKPRVGRRRATVAAPRVPAQRGSAAEAEVAATRVKLAAEAAARVALRR